VHENYELSEMLARDVSWQNGIVMSWTHWWEKMTTAAAMTHHVVSTTHVAAMTHACPWRRQQKLWSHVRYDYDARLCGTVVERRSLTGELSTRSSTATRRTRSAVPLPGCRTIVSVLRILFSRLSMLPSFQTLLANSLNSHRAPLLLWQSKIFNQNRIFLWNFHDFV